MFTGNSTGASMERPRCGAIGGGLGDALLVADRCQAEALHAVAPAVQGCKVEVDAAGHRWRGKLVGFESDGKL